MRYLVTGGCGFLGSNLAAEVLRRGEKLFVLDNLHRKGASQNLQWLHSQGDTTFFHADIRNRADVDNAVSESNPDAIFHLAGQVAMTTSLARPRLDFEVNAMGTLNLLEAVRKYAPAATVVFSSTNKVYGNMEHVVYAEESTRYATPDYPEGFDESASLDFHSPYGCSKGAADQYVLDYARMFGLKTVVFRHSSIYGDRQFATIDQGWVTWFCMKALEKAESSSQEPFTIAGNGKQVRDVLHVADAARAYLAAVERIENVCGQAFNIGGTMASSLSLLELFSMLERLLGIKLAYRKLPPRVGDQKVFVANTALAGRLLGWVPSVNAEEGVKKLLEWLREYLPSPA